MMSFFLILWKKTGAHPEVWYFSAVSKNVEFCAKNVEFCAKNEELCIWNDELCSGEGIRLTSSLEEVSFTLKVKIHQQQKENEDSSRGFGWQVREASAGAAEVSKIDEFCIKTEKRCVVNEELCIENEELCTKYDEFWRTA